MASHSSSCLLTELFLTRLWGCLTPQKTGPTNSYNYTLKEQLILNGVKHILRHRVGKFWCLSRFQWHRAPEPPAPPGWGEELEGPSVSAAKGLIPSQPLCFLWNLCKVSIAFHLPCTLYSHGLRARSLCLFRCLTVRTLLLLRISGLPAYCLC